MFLILLFCYNKLWNAFIEFLNVCRHFLVQLFLTVIGYGFCVLRFFFNVIAVQIALILCFTAFFSVLSESEHKKVQEIGLTEALEWCRIDFNHKHQCSFTKNEIFRPSKTGTQDNT